MPLLLFPVGAYLYGRFVDGDDGFPWARIALMLVAAGVVIYMVRRK